MACFSEHKNKKRLKRFLKKVLLKYTITTAGAITPLSSTLVFWVLWCTYCTLLDLNVSVMFSPELFIQTLMTDCLHPFILVYLLICIRTLHSFSRSQRWYPIIIACQQKTKTTLSSMKRACRLTAPLRSNKGVSHHKKTGVGQNISESAALSGRAGLRDSAVILAANIISFSKSNIHQTWLLRHLKKNSVPAANRPPLMSERKAVVGVAR